MDAAAKDGTDVAICDTSGRLHNNWRLMEELGRCKAAIQKRLPEAPHEVLLVLDGTNGAPLSMPPFFHTHCCSDIPGTAHASLMKKWGLRVSRGPTDATVGRNRRPCHCPGGATSCSGAGKGLSAEALLQSGMTQYFKRFSKARRWLFVLQSVQNQLARAQDTTWLAWGGTQKSPLEGCSS